MTVQELFTRQSELGCSYDAHVYTCRTETMTRLRADGDTNQVLARGQHDKHNKGADSSPRVL